MRTIGTSSLLLLFGQIIAAASAACSQSASPLVSHHDDAGATLDSGADTDADVDSGPIGCGGCGCGGGSSWIATVDGGLDAEAGLDCPTLCQTPGRSASTGFCALLDATAPATISCQQDCTGRRPEGLRRGASPSPCAIGAYFASMAQLEAASVPAFRRVARELSGFGAPRRLVRAAERAARDEIRHARAARALARMHGAVDASFAHAPDRRRSLEDFAVENAVEGCVRETYGALVATWQARQASDPCVRAHFAQIARDETTHAALALRVDAWARARLDRAARARVATARDDARAELLASVERDAPDAALARVAGVPPKSVAIALASLLAARLPAS